ncbi:hypothetical protein [Actinophytocola algeriensis]|uniref:Uncharacterized protein n=1 Tax=Actinophytocola algeriensis TaxID=1768010 RepID=A0A7W7Q613_9PSEU|nr:hypothetical protein [Actinophytocola algeriensis]MBB4907463.1 hypothetical protein [Actinophytocola algeriensis]MBE1479493.1 hypothetical protein [Actinophytocola algeriensis]
MGLPYGTLGGSGLPVTAKPLAAKRAPVAAADVAPVSGNPTTAAAAKAGGVPPMMPPMAGQGAGAAARPPRGTVPSGRSRTTRRQADGTGAVPADLRGRSAE